MPRIVLARNLQHEQVEFPQGTPYPESRRKGESGALHLRRGSMRDVTAEELAFIKEHHPELYKCLDVLPEPKASPALARKLASLERARASDLGSKARAKKASSKPSKPTSKAK